ncbi:MAG: helix-turn-helix transcriptional regulator [Ruminococcaceae bacterium]|nr:helix-turn-helix transcriptional regulator [Oscillospiraceae bacterium]
MDQIKIGRFVAACRKKAGLTQAQLAEKLGVTDRAVSKWETGRAMPDSSLMLPLCELLDISVNDLLCGEKVTAGDYAHELENNLLLALKEKERADRQLLFVEIVLGITVSLVLLSAILLASYAELAVWQRAGLIAAGGAVFFVGVTCALRIEQTAGYYRCGKCGHRYVPTFKSVLLAAHVNRTRFMRCPACGKKSWQKKVIEKNRE